MLFLTYIALATTDELFRHKSRDFKLEDFPGYTSDQWGIKAHNRPWIEDAGEFSPGQKIIEVGGGYSLLPKYLSDKYALESWVGDDFGLTAGESMWARWGSPSEFSSRYPSVKYVFERFGEHSPKYPDAYFDRIFSVSTLEHVPPHQRMAVLKDIHRCLAPHGREIHTVDIETHSPERVILSAFLDWIPVLGRMSGKYVSEIRNWVELVKESGVKVATPVPNPIRLLDRHILVESPDVVYRFYPPNDAPKPYCPSASLLLIVEDL